MTAYFVTGTDTGIGKTLVSAILTRALQAAYWKPIQTGVAEETADSDTVLQLSGLTARHILPSAYVYQAPLSPDQAAALEDQTIDVTHLTLPKTELPYLIVEGAGGVMVPINRNTVMRDLIQQLNIPAIIVARGTLGTINHTLLTILALKEKRIPIHGVIFSGPLNPANQLAIETYGEVQTLFAVPELTQYNAATIQAYVDQQAKALRKSFL